MKPRLFPILLLTLGSMNFAACQKDSAEKLTAQKQINRSVGIAAEITHASDTRTAFNPTDGMVAITGQEKIHVYFAASEGASQMAEAKNSSSQEPISIEKDGVNHWTCSFQHADQGVAAYDYFFVLPYSVRASIAGVGVSQHELAYEQFPSEDGVTFDSDADILIGRKLTIDAQDQSAAQPVNFARLFVPFKVLLKDTDGLIGSNAIKSVEFSAPAADDALTGTYKVTHAVFENAILTECITAERKVKASYANGLAAGVDGFDVWYIVNPTTLHGAITITVVTDTRTLTCTVNPGDKEIVPNKINKVSISLKQANTTVVENNVDLQEQYNAGKDITIGGVTINKEAYGNAQTPVAGPLASPTNATVYFLGDGTYTLNSAGRQVLIALKGTKPVVELSASKSITGDFICRGITLKNASSLASYLFNIENKAATAINYFVLDGCKIANTQNISYFSGAALLRNIIVRNCMFALNPPAEFGSVRLLNFGGVNVANIANIEKVEFSNNVVYSQKSVNGCIFAADVVATGKAEITICNNTFINYICSSFPSVTILKAKSIEYRNNLMWIGATGYTGKTAFYLTKIISADGTAPSPEPTMLFANNFTYTANANIGFAFYPASGVWKPEFEALVGDNSVDPFGDGVFSFETETFIPANAYTAYGAQR